VPIQPGSGCVLGTGITGGPATWINVFAPAAGSSVNVSSGTGLGNCPTGGGGSVGPGFGPLGPQPIGNSQSVNPATSSIWSQTAAPNITTTGSITAGDANQACTSVGWGTQNACIGTPTVNSAYQVAVTSAGYIWVQAITTGGTMTANFAIRISNDGGITWFNRGIFAVTQNAPFQVNNITNPNFAGWLPGGVTNVEVIATSWSILTGTPTTAITITQGQATPFTTSSAISTSLNGTGSNAAANMQGNGVAALPVNNDIQQWNNTPITNVPTAVGVAGTGNTPTVNAYIVGGTITGVGPLGPQPIGNSQSVNPATSSIWATVNAPNTITTGTINTVDALQICSSTNWGNQTACIGTPTSGSAYQVPVSSAGYLWVQVTTSGGTVTPNFVVRISNDGGTTWFNRGVFELTNVAPFQINNINTQNFAGWLTGGVTNVEVIATTYTVLTGTPITTVSITQGQATPFVTSSATSSSLNGTGSSAATNTQGNGPTALPINTDMQQLANIALGAPTAWGSAPPPGTIVPNMNVNIAGGSLSASFAGYSPVSYGTPLPVNSSTSNSVTAPAGATVVLYNTSSTTFVDTTIHTTSATATTAMDRIAPGGCFAYAQSGTEVVAGIAESGATNINISAGSGWPIGCGGAGAGGGGGASSAFGSPFPASGTAVGFTNPLGNMGPGKLDANGNVMVSGGVVQGNLTPIWSASSAVTQLLVLGISGKVVTVTGMHCYLQGNVTAGNFGDCQLVQGTGALCAGSQTPLSEQYIITPGNGIWPTGLGPLFTGLASNGVCVKTTFPNPVVGGIVAIQQ
jgi:hypothetical protein